MYFNIFNTKNLPPTSSGFESEGINCLFAFATSRSLQSKEAIFKNMKQFPLQQPSTEVHQTNLMYNFQSFAKEHVN